MTARFHFMGHPIYGAMVAKLPDRLVVQDMADGRLVVRMRTERTVAVPAPRKAA